MKSQHKSVSPQIYTEMFWVLSNSDHIHFIGRILLYLSTECRLLNIGVFIYISKITYALSVIVICYIVNSPPIISNRRKSPTSSITLPSLQIGFPFYGMFKHRSIFVKAQSITPHDVTWYLYQINILEMASPDRANGKVGLADLVGTRTNGNTRPQHGRKWMEAAGYNRQNINTHTNIIQLYNLSTNELLT